MQRISFPQSESTLKRALFINGVFEEVLTDILNSQEVRRGGESFLQPYKGQQIAILRDYPPSPEQPIRLYLSTTKHLSQICYTAEIVKWEDKRALSNRRFSAVSKHLTEHQQGETNLFHGLEQAGEKSVNLITIRNLRRPDSMLSTSVLRKVSDGLPLGYQARWVE